MKHSKFFKLPDERVAFKDFVNEISADGGGDEPENGLEALDFAVRSDWTKESTKRRHVIVVFTDASAHPLEKSGKPAGYPSGMAKDINELTDRWEGDEYVGASAKRLLIFAPDAEPWTAIHKSWTNTIYLPSAAGHGLSEVDYSQILDVIANSV
jgi:hypothetical protein